MQFSSEATTSARQPSQTLSRVDRVLSSRLIGGSNAALRLAAPVPGARRVWRSIAVLLSLEVVVGIATLVVAFFFRHADGLVTPASWFRGTVVLLMTLTLFGFAWAARRGYWWAYWRLRLFSQIFPVVTLAIAAVPGLYPLWMTIEQIVFSVLLIGVGDYLTGDRMREWYPNPRLRPDAYVTVRVD
ncbi:hypothetical protein [Pseudoclavibacter sp. 13-3]|uniref:hypothetical protein n=1 Tax=Pseudoclavibacter sp. 13-3 TaxID=2901228 RepID=UPI001E2B7F46|nr:hypothetical protein [Pseudoclavibacter sp. 13-3]MCD7100818.1 hypothetical protein [Pseudoclavibacter sp. 13-3]